MIRLFFDAIFIDGNLNKFPVKSFNKGPVNQQFQPNIRSAGGYLSNKLKRAQRGHYNTLIFRSKFFSIKNLIQLKLNSFVPKSSNSNSADKPKFNANILVVLNVVWKIVIDVVIA